MLAFFLIELVLFTVFVVCVVADTRSYRKKIAKSLEKRKESKVVRLKRFF